MSSDICNVQCYMQYPMIYAMSNVICNVQFYMQYACAEGGVLTYP